MMHLLGLVLLASLAGQSLCGQKPAIYPLTFATKPAENKRLSLNCLLSDGEQNASFDWFLNGQKVNLNENVYVSQLEEGSMLTVKQMSLELAGEYECRASNPFGQDSQSISVRLEVKPKFLVEPTDLLTKLNSPLSVRCKTTGLPSPTTRWEKLSLNGDVERLFESDELAFNFTRNDAGQYRCSSENKLARIEKTIRIGFYGR